MGDSDFLYQRFGDVTSPTVAADVSNGNLTSCWDPGQDALLAFFKAVLNQEMTAAWDVAKAGTKLALASPVEDTMWSAPVKAILNATKWSFPLLCVYRTSANHEEETLVEEKTTSTWGLDYILGPLNVADYRRLGGALNGALGFIKLAVRNKSHLAYNSDARQFEEGGGQFDSIKLTSSQIGPAEFGETEEGVIYYALHCELETVETDRFVDGTATTYLGFTLHEHVGDANDVLPDTVIAQSD